ncbi:hypothetical protein, partial [Pseudomonas syringae]|uniref:hypothetical protein n=1 Tax=Pseudomonas syringae TaxID=317 RepID=UPI001F17B772
SQDLPVRRENTNIIMFNGEQRIALQPGELDKIRVYLSAHRPHVPSAYSQVTGVSRVVFMTLRSETTGPERNRDTLAA